MDETGREIARGFGSGYPGGEAPKAVHLITPNCCRGILIDSWNRISVLFSFSQLCVNGVCDQDHDSF